MVQNIPTCDKILGNERQCCKKCNSDESLFRQIIMDDGGKISYTIDDYMVVFLKDGDMDFEWKGKMNCRMEQGDFFILSPGSMIEVYARNKLSLFMFRLDLELCLCEEFQIDTLYGNNLKIEMENEILKSNIALRYFIDSFDYCINKGLFCKYYTKLKIKEMMYILRTFYSPAELAAFFGPVFNENVLFKGFILRNWDKVNSVEEFAKLANYSRETFTRKFQKVMGKSPMSWMKAEKAALIAHDLLYTHKPLKEISDVYGFSSPSVLNQFCLKYLGNTPARIRKSGNLAL